MIGVLPLFHPRGDTARIALLGAACSAEVAAPGTFPNTAELVLIAPSRGELADRGWLRRAVESAAALVTDDGVAYVLVPPASRARARRMMREAGLRIEHEVLHLPSWGATEYVIPADRRAFRYAMETFVPMTRRRRWAARVLVSVPGAARLLGLLHSSSALVARRPNARPVFDWFVAAAPGAATILVRIKRRGARRSIVLQALDASGHPVALAKATLDVDGGGVVHRAEREAECLRHLGPAARVSGVTVPEGRIVCAGPRPVLIETIVPGTRVSDLIRARRVRADMVIERLVRWLDAWNCATAVYTSLDHIYLDRMVLAPARRLASEMENGTTYVDWLEARCRAVANAAVPLVATHNDLTMSNVLFDEALGLDRGLGVVDWESAESDGLPLRDFWYAAVDAVAAADGYTDRVAAFRRCTSTTDPLGQLVTGRAAHLAMALKLSDDFATLCFHACWLQHAADERMKRRAHEARPFRAIVQALASDPPRFRDIVGAAT